MLHSSLLPWLRPAHRSRQQGCQAHTKACRQLLGTGLLAGYSMLQNSSLCIARGRLQWRQCASSVALQRRPSRLHKGISPSDTKFMVHVQYSALLWRMQGRALHPLHLQSTRNLWVLAGTAG
jgi:hypothetical protein